MSELISVIVPVYNVEQYLEKCIDSIINQTYKNLEIILVDDGSTDNSSNLCDLLAKKDSRIAVYHKENGGLSSARNFGIDKANGEFIGFIDSDDYIDNDMYETLYNLIKQDKSDVSMCGLYNIYANRKDSQVKEVKKYLMNAEEAIQMVLDSKITSVTAVNKLYRKEIFSDLRYDLGKTSEDAFLIVRLLDKCNLISVTDERKYYYYHRANSITKKPFSEKSMDVIDAYNLNYSIVKEKYPKITSSAKRRVLWAYFYVLDLLCVSEDRYKYDKLANELIYKLKKDTWFILNSPYFTLKRKVLFISIFISEKLYKKIILKLKNRAH